MGYISEKFKECGCFMIVQKSVVSFELYMVCMIFFVVGLLSKNLLARHTVEWSREERRAVDSGREDRCNGRVPKLVVVKNQGLAWLGSAPLQPLHSVDLLFN